MPLILKKGFRMVRPPLFSAKKFLLPKETRGILFVLGAALSALATNSITHSFDVSYSPYQILFFKTFVALSCVLSFTLHQAKVCHDLGRLWFWQCARGTIGFLGNLFWIQALQRLPLAKACSLSLLSAVFTAVGGIIFYQERSHWSIWVALMLGAAGVVMIERPENFCGAFSYLPVLSALCFSGSSLLIKKISREVNAQSALISLLFYMMLFSLVPAYYTWTPLVSTDLYKLVGLGLSYMGTQYGLIKAYSYAPASLLAPFKFARVPLNMGIGILIFSEIPPWSVVFGAGCILVGYYVLFYFRKKR